MTNQAVIADHKVRCNNYDKLLENLRQLNKTIEKGARLRGKQLLFFAFFSILFYFFLHSDL